MVLAVFFELVDLTFFTFCFFIILGSLFELFIHIFIPETKIFLKLLENFLIFFSQGKQKVKKRLEKQYWHVEDLIQAETKIIVKNPENFSESVVLFQDFCYSMDISDKLKIKKKGIRSMRKGMKHSDETKAKISVGNKGKKLSDETKAKISVGNKGKKLSDETKAKMSAAHKGKKLSDETKAKLSAAHKGNGNPMKGKTHTPEAKAKLSAAHKGKTLSDETKGKMVIKSIISGNKAKPVLCITTGENFSSQNEAARCLFDNTMDSLMISACCKGKVSHFKGYQFRYI